MKKHTMVLLLFLSIVFGCTQQKTENLETFAKAYGYVKYFHPSDDAFKLDWEKFSAYGAREIMKCNSKKEVLLTLNTLFKPFAPSVYFNDSARLPENYIQDFTPKNTGRFTQVYWQHLGVNFDINSPLEKYNVYKSIRVGRTSSDFPLFTGRPEFGKMISKKIGNGIYCHIPMVLYCDQKSTYPASDSIALKKLRDNLARFDYNEEKQLPMRLGNIIIIYNVFQHFYPYFDVVDVNWDHEFRKALTKTFEDTSQADYLLTLQKFTAPLKDGHMNVMFRNNSTSSFSPPISWEWIENKLVITHIYENIPNLQVGDVVTTIDGKSAHAYFKELYSTISESTPGWLNFKASLLSLLGEKNTKIKLTVNNKTVELTRKAFVEEYLNMKKSRKPRYQTLGNGILYLNINRIEIDTINKIMPELEKSKAIICDARGYPNNNDELLTHFMSIDDTTQGWMKIPQIIYPDHPNCTYANCNWIPIMKKHKPYLGNKKIIYIVDGSAISYAESCLGYVEGYKFARIIGQPSAGTNGNVNPFNLPGGYTVVWTGMKVVKHNGSQHHDIGIKPDIYVKKTIKGIKEQHDEFLEKAIEMANR